MKKGFIARLVVRPEARAEFERLQIELKRLTHENEPGTPVYELMRSADDPCVYMVVATFDSEEAFEIHQTSSFNDKLVPPILACLAQDMELAFYDVLG